MANRFKNFFEQIVYAGMKPETRSSEDPVAKSNWISRFLNGPEQADPLYLTNQTFGQKARRVLFMLSPMIVVIVGGVVAILLLAPKTTNAPKALTAAEISAKVLPEFDHKQFNLETNRNLEVTEVRFEHTKGTEIVGSIRNKTNRQIIQATVIFSLANADNSDLGAVTVTETDIAPGATREFRKPIEQTNAVYALVRDVDTK